ncbi:hypothetical protein ACOMHN_020035 [Nucella lapillus]
MTFIRTKAEDAAFSITRKKKKERTTNKLTILGGRDTAGERNGHRQTNDTKKNGGTTNDPGSTGEGTDLLNKMTGGTGDRAITMGNDSVGSGELTATDTDHINHMATSCSTTGTETMDRTGE